MDILINPNHCYYNKNESIDFDRPPLSMFDIQASKNLNPAMDCSLLMDYLKLNPPKILSHYYDNIQYTLLHILGSLLRCNLGILNHLESQEYNHYSRWNLHMGGTVHY